MRLKKTDCMIAVRAICEYPLEVLGYQLQESFLHLRPPAIPDDVYLPYSKLLTTGEYVHVVFLHTWIPRIPTQTFRILLLRYAGKEPWEAWAVPIPGRPRTNISGYLPSLSDPPLPLMLAERSARWSFATRTELEVALHTAWERFVTSVLPLFEDGRLQQFVEIDVKILLPAFRAYVYKEWDGDRAYQAIAPFCEFPNYYTYFSDINQSRLVNEVIRILFQAQHSLHLRRKSDDILQYLLNCLEGNSDFQIETWHDMLDQKLAARLKAEAIAAGQELGS